jgi:hypothetical protein
MGPVVDLWCLQPRSRCMFCHLLHSVPRSLTETTQICHLVSRELLHVPSHSALHRPLFSLPISITRPYYLLRDRFDCVTGFAHDMM